MNSLSNRGADFSEPRTHQGDRGPASSRVARSALDTLIETIARSRLMMGFLLAEP